VYFLNITKEITRYHKGYEKSHYTSHRNFRFPRVRYGFSQMFAGARCSAIKFEFEGQEPFWACVRDTIEVSVFDMHGNDNRRFE